MQADGDLGKLLLLSEIDDGDGAGGSDAAGIDHGLRPAAVGSLVALPRAAPAPVGDVGDRPVARDGDVIRRDADGNLGRHVAAAQIDHRDAVRHRQTDDRALLRQQGDAAGVAHFFRKADLPAPRQRPLGRHVGFQQHGAAAGHVDARAVGADRDAVHRCAAGLFRQLQLLAHGPRRRIDRQEVRVALDVQGLAVGRQSQVHRPALELDAPAGGADELLRGDERPALDRPDARLLRGARRRRQQRKDNQRGNDGAVHTQ